MGNTTAVPFIYFAPLITMSPVLGTVIKVILNMPLLGGEADCTDIPVDLYPEVQLDGLLHISYDMLNVALV
ncbi:MAG: hypothetical protein M1128_03195 [Candidatus Marsarchaeota archaeon]|nr:hypothetical protein [Candidatus Marsarchaeota archaeon]